LATLVAEAVAQIRRETGRTSGFALARRVDAQLIWHLIGQARSQLLGPLEVFR